MCTGELTRNSRRLTNGTPWITGWATYADGYHSIYQMQTGAVWLDMQNDVGIHIAVSAVGNLGWALSELQPDQFGRPQEVRRAFGGTGGF